MRKVWNFSAIVFAVAALSAASADVEFFFQSGDQAWLNGGRSLDQTALREKYGDHFAAMVRDGRTYVITNRAALDRVQRLYAPVAELGRQQAVLGSKQAALGNEQARLGQEQAIIGAEQAALASADERGASRELSARQHALGQKQRALGDRQRALGDQQRTLGERQRELARETLPKIERIFNDAIATGTAIEVR